MKVLKEHTYGNHIFMEIELDGKREEIDCFCGLDYSWNHFRTTADNDPNRRKQVIEAFKELY